MTDPIFKIMTSAEWQNTRKEGVFTGSQADLEDGFIHFSSASQVRETARRHFAGRNDLVLLWVEEALIADGLKWEPARGGALFPHLYAKLDPGMAIAIHDLVATEDGGHHFPGDF